MAKVKDLFRCNACAYESPKWLGKCPQCEGWNSFTEFLAPKKGEVEGGVSMPLHSLREITSHVLPHRLTTGIMELDTLLGGGFLEGSITLLAGEPGIGKSTLTMQIAAALRTQNVLYISGEESANQIKSRAMRLNTSMEHVSLMECTSLENILQTLREHSPAFVVVDSVQVMSSEAAPGYSGSIGQIRFITEALMQYAKTTDTTILLIGHVNKEGDLAGPKVLEHLVDTVLVLEGERSQELRTLRSMKNRFGSTNEIGLFTMSEEGLKEMHNLSAHLCEQRKEHTIGSCLSMVMEGSRPLLVEVQALTHVTPFGYPKRSSTGYDLNRLQMLTAIIQKFTSVNLLNQDIFINIVGGLRVSDPAVDLAAAMAILSSFYGKAIEKDLVAFGELGLSGEIRRTLNHERRIKECEKLKLSPLKNTLKF